MEQEKNDVLEKNKQRISLLQIEALLIITIGAGTVGLIFRIMKDLSTLAIVFALWGCFLVIILTFMFIKSYLKTKKIIK